MRPIIKPKKNTMKKLLAILAVAGTLTACNGSGDDKAASTDSSKMTPVVDATKTADTAKKMMADTSSKMNNMMDTAKKMMDKAADKMKDAGKMVEKAKEAVKH